MSFHSIFLTHVGVRFNKLLSKAESGKMRSSEVHYPVVKSSDAQGAKIYASKLRNNKNCDFGADVQGRYTYTKANNIQ